VSREMSNVWCVRAGSGAYAKQFVQGRYVGVNFEIDPDLSGVSSRGELTELYREAHPDETSNVVIGQQVGQLARFLFDMQKDDYVLTPAAGTGSLHYGIITDEESYADTSDDSPYPIRRHVKWIGTLDRSGLSVPFQNTIRSMLTVFAVSQRDEFLAAIGLVVQPTGGEYDPYRAVLEQVLELTPKEFEILVGHLLTAVGFEGSEVTGRSGDGGVDATGVLSVAGLAQVKTYVQAKRYKVDTKIQAGVVKQLRAAIPSGAQGAFITTARFQDSASNIASEPGFPRIGLVNGHQLVDLLVEHWDDIPAEFQERLGLKKGLVRAYQAGSGSSGVGPSTKRTAAQNQEERGSTSSRGLGRAERNYWADLYNEETWRESRQQGLTLSGFGENMRARAEHIRPGDVLLCYVLGAQRWVGALEVIGPSTEVTAVWKKGTYPVRFSVKPIVALPLDQGVPQHQLDDRANPLCSSTARHRLSGIVRGSPTRFSHVEDAQAVLDALKAAKRGD